MVLNATECPEHPSWVVVPWFGFRACCLYAALERIRETDQDPKMIASLALETDLKGVPSFVRDTVIIHVARQVAGGEHLLTLRQARSVVAKLHGAKRAILDMEGVETMGAAFAERLFTTVRSRQPELQLECVNAGPGVDRVVEYWMQAAVAE